jgi:peptidoglycan/LPS O-acetylase OafA/YrhL
VVCGIPQFAPIGLLWTVMIFPLTSLGLIALFPAVLKLTEGPPRFRRIVGSISNCFYSLYMTHFSLLARSWTCGGSISAIEAAALSFLSSIVLSWLAFSFFERPILMRRAPQFSSMQTGGRLVDESPS